MSFLVVILIIIVVFTVWNVSDNSPKTHKQYNYVNYVALGKDIILEQFQLITFQKKYITFSHYHKDKLTIQSVEYKEGGTFYYCLDGSNVKCVVVVGRHKNVTSLIYNEDLLMIFSNERIEDL